ncbi:hypothetical protein RRG08_057508 [Elysia crispata]|uniref:Ig-like domain-containing protein n=1 Tax=Elysia crispata TaxID=231223 RepID=A0AAE0Y2R2_9GAST|nr:hypothetical protein RRG08_057508 [Elysia crispata]
MFQKGYGYSTINSARAALSSVNDTGSEPLVCRFMRGLFNLRPARPRYSSIWDVSIVLNYLRRLVPAANLSLHMLSAKLVTLLALVTTMPGTSCPGHRVYASLRDTLSPHAGVTKDTLARWLKIILKPVQTYTCEAVSDLGRRVGSTLTAKFAFIVSDSVEVESTPDTINLCYNNNDQARVTCRISKDNVNPGPTFSFSSDGLKFDSSRVGTVSKDGNYYQGQFSLSPGAGGEYQVTCRVTHTVLNTWQDKGTIITYRKPPPATPRITVGKDSYQGVRPSNIVTLTEGYSGDVTCRVQGGYPDARNTQLKCGQLVDTGAGHTAVLSFTADQLTRELNGAVCTCTSQHGSRCYSNKETQLTLNVLCKYISCEQC